ncbi:dipeptide ABC transporter ATP-binding protein [Agromyces larvae]|uniref:ABC transporter ATP-binding protein n=1 Tax=Agromyces larvae TaxID=2929802 RepID=A0ABY4BVC4_9MICO|nr:ABC transporter ATP-binding protein [Agromyces larvae]UOE43128.1 ABC transporter ATP-binding protein [Agromyces larvae]
MTHLETPAGEDLVSVEGLDIGFDTPSGRVQVVHDVTFTVRAGRALALVGESGSGKTVTARSLLGLSGEGATVTARRRDLLGRDVRNLDERAWRKIRGRHVGFVLQDALVSLDPLRTIGQEIDEGLRIHRFGSKPERGLRAIDSLVRAGVPEPELRRDQRSGELSGGLRQRALIAQAIALQPRLIIADEPTTALDVTVQAQILDLLGSLKADGNGLLVISHDLAVVAELADEVAVMQDGRIVEHGPTEQVLGDPRHPYTKRLLAAVPAAHPKGTRLSELPPAEIRPRTHRPSELSEAAPAIEAEGLVKRYRGPDGRIRTVVDEVGFTLRTGTSLGIVGESGSGKSTTARLVLGLIAPDAGQVRIGGLPWVPSGEHDRRPHRPEIQLVQQDPLSAFDPRHTVEKVLLDALDAGGVPRSARADRLTELLDQVGLARVLSTRVPLTLSGGQRQRVAIARALAVEPKVLVLDEPVSALDVSIQAQVLDLFADLQRELGLSYLFISHDLGVVRHVADDVLVLKDGRVVESGSVDDIFEHAQHDYTRTLLDSVLSLPTGTGGQDDGGDPNGSTTGNRELEGAIR